MTRADAAAPAIVTRPALAQGVRWLARRDRDLRRLVTRFGHPPLWARRPGFTTLVHIILEQQVSLASARAAFDRLRAETGQLTPRRFLRLDDIRLRKVGFSRQKTAYCRAVAEAILERRLDLAKLTSMPDAAVRETLLAHKGVGPWTADIYLLMALQRRDIWPAGDLALAGAALTVKGLSERPSPDELEAIASEWRPWRAVAARLLWHQYLSTTGSRTVKLAKAGGTSGRGR